MSFSQIIVTYQSADSESTLNQETKKKIYQILHRICGWLDKFKAEITY